MTPRLCPHIPLPAAAHVPGRTTRPHRLFDGLWPAVTQFDTTTWSSTTPYLMGFDLFHEGFFWEAHEVWEEVWHRCRPTLEGQLLKSCILTTASRLKETMNEPGQAERLIARACALTEQMVDMATPIAGIEPNQLLEAQKQRPVSRLPVPGAG